MTDDATTAEPEELRCGDCDRPIYWDEERKTYRHKTEPEWGCFLIRAEEPEAEKESDE